MAGTAVKAVGCPVGFLMGWEDELCAMAAFPLTLKSLIRMVGERSGPKILP